MDGTSGGKKGGGKHKGVKSGHNSKGYADGGGRGKGKGKGGKSGEAQSGNWDEAQLRSLQGGRPFSLADLDKPRPQRVVEAFPQLTVAADWAEKRQPRSGSAFYLPMIWTALLLEDLEPGFGGRGGLSGAARQQLESLGDARHFHDGRARRSTLEDIRVAQKFWSSVFSGWADWVRRLRAAMDSHQPGGRDGIVTSYVQRTSVTACALIYGDLLALGALPHISNARATPHQDAILELDFALRCEVEASIATLYLPQPQHLQAPVPAAESAPLGSTPSAAPPQDGSATSTLSDAEKEIMRLRKKLREIEQLKAAPPESLDPLQRRKLDIEDEVSVRGNRALSKGASLMAQRDVFEASQALAARALRYMK
eukprot:TRINITY_DN6631_c0_g1_i1.p1 TRINITY_DN6631_c0_g1~~TRINITY_DN6631_c0_g1_i1.p1  ORF type:complete len:390 (-),score=80.67 TRINITY_DN6631_c0_g1_i1:85-1188(-)